MKNSRKLSINGYCTGGD